MQMGKGRTRGGILTCGFGGEIDRDGGDLVVGGVLVEFRHEEVIVLHAKGELLHVWEGESQLASAKTS
jgi:hypothetical protein